MDVMEMRRRLMSAMSTGYFTKKESGIYIPDENILKYVTISHNLGEKPKMAMIAIDPSEEITEQSTTGMIVVFTDGLFDHPLYNTSLISPYCVMSEIKNQYRNYFEVSSYRSGYATGDNFNSKSSDSVFMFATYSSNYPIIANKKYNWIIYA